MKKSFIKRRKRVMPASGQETRPRQDQPSSVSVSPDPQHSSIPQRPYESPYDSLVPSQSVPNIDPMLDVRRAKSLSQERSYLPPPVDFTSYAPPRSHAIPSVPHFEHYDPVHDNERSFEHDQSHAHPAKRRRSLSPARQALQHPLSTAAPNGFMADLTGSSPILDQHMNRHATVGEPAADAKASKKEKARFLAEEIRRMQMQLDELGGDISGDEDDGGEG